MAYPNVNIAVQNGNVGAVVPLADGVCGMVIGDDPTGASPAITIGSVYTFNSIADAQAAGFSTATSGFAYKQISAFYNEAGDGNKLHVMMVPNTVLFAAMCDKADANAYAKKLLDNVQGNIRFLGVCRKPAAGYTPTYVKGYDDDCFNAIVKMQALCDDAAARFQPCFGLIEVRDYQGNATSLVAVNTGTTNRVGMVNFTTDAFVTSGVSDKSSNVGIVLGRLAKLPVQRKISRVKDGAMLVSTAYLVAAAGGTVKAAEYMAAESEAITSKGFITARTFVGRSGYYLADDPLATVPTDDYAYITHRRVIDKAIRIVYNTYVNELNDEVLIDTAGKISPSVAKSYQGKIDNAVNQSMTANEEISSFSSFVDINQNVIATGKVTVVCKVIPVGYARVIYVKLGFSNPAA